MRKIVKVYVGDANGKAVRVILPIIGAAEIAALFA